MKSIDMLLSGPATVALGWTLLHALWQGFALVLPAAVALHVLRSGRAQTRYVVGVATLGAQVLASVVTFAWYYEPNVVAAQLPSAPTPYVLPAVYYVPGLDASAGGPLLAVQHFLHAHLTELVGGWLLGVALLLLRLAGGWYYVQRLKQTAQPATSSVSAYVVDELRRALGIGRPVRVLESARVAGPLVLGWLKPVVLLPVGLAAGLSLREIEAVLAHELAHVRRHDYVVNLLQSVVEVLYFFHPALWWLSARVREEREHCCDDLAVQACGDARALAQALARVEAFAQATTLAQPPLALAFAGRRAQLLNRVRRVLGVPGRPAVSNGSLAGLTLATLLLLSVSVYAVQQQGEKPKPPRRDVTVHFAQNGRVTRIERDGQLLSERETARLMQLYGQLENGEIRLGAIPDATDRQILHTVQQTHVDALRGRSGSVKVDLPADTLSNDPPANRPSPDFKQLTMLGQPVEVFAPAYHVVNGTVGVVPAAQFPTDSAKRAQAHRRLDSLTAQMNQVMAGRRGQIEQLSKQMAELSLKNKDWQQQLRPLVQKQGELARQQAELGRKQARLATEMIQLERRNDARSKTLLKQKQAQERALEGQMEQLAQRMEQLGRQAEPLHNKVFPEQEKLSRLADSLARLHEPLTALAEQIAEESQTLAEQAMEQAQAALEALDWEDAPDYPARPARPARPPRPPRPARQHVIGHPLPTPAAPAAPHQIHGNVVKPAKPVAPAGVKPARPAPAPKGSAVKPAPRSN